MADPSPSPSGSSRRLSDLLDERQEPFSLDLYLLEKRCSPALLDAAAGGSGACSTCWPMTRRRGRTLMRLAASKKCPRLMSASSVVRLLLSKILGCSTARKRQPPAIDWRRVDDKQRTPGPFTNGATSSASPSCLGADKVAAEVDAEDDHGDEKQLSPVSVLQQRLFEQGSPAYAQKALLIFGELLKAVYTPTLLDQLAKDSNNNNSKDGRHADTLPAARNNLAHLKEDLLNEELAQVTDIIASDMAGSRVWPGDMQPERHDIVVDIAAAVLEGLVEEAAAELIETDRDIAVEG